MSQSLPGRRWFRFSAVTALSLTLIPAPAGNEKPPSVFDTGIVESTEVTLMLLDVNAVDRDGKPMRGLKRGDFAVRLDGRLWAIETVDDLCPCGGEPGGEVAGAGDAPNNEAESLATDETATEHGATAISSPGELSPPAGEGVAPRPAEPEPVRFVLYLEYSQLRQDGRRRAIDEARRWIQETMRPGDLVLIAAYSEPAGLKTLVRFTADKEQLLSAVNHSAGAPEWFDPFPSSRHSRIEGCLALFYPYVCLLDLARAEYRHTRRSFLALKTLLSSLAEVPGRKALVLFNQDGTMFPARYYPEVDETQVGDHIGLVDEVGAQATTARTAIYAAFSGENENDLGVNLGANLADFTGGGYNRGVHDLTDLTRRAGRGCECVYRLGMAPPGGKSGAVHRVTVEIRDRQAPNTYRVQYLNAADRWMRSAQAVLADPDASTDLPLVAAIVPVAGRDGTWDIAVRVTSSPKSLALLSGASGIRGSWEVGALLWQEDGRKRWELLAISEIRKQRDDATGTAVLHERVIEGVPPGTYELRAFVRDRWANLYGGARARMELPRTRETTAGPLVLRAEAGFVRTQLPLRQEKVPTRPESAREIERGLLPLGERSVRAGEPLACLTWVCPGESKDSVYETVRFLSREDEPVLIFEEPEIVKAGRCVRIGDRIDTSGLAPGRYVYHVGWNPDADERSQDVEAAFEVAAGDEQAPETAP